LDGAIVVWQVETLTPLKVLYFPDSYVSSQDKVYIHNVRKLEVLNEHFLAAAIGNG
jgi:hypothetical protein